MECDLIYQTRTFKFEPLNKRITILMQNENGPCLLIAIVNALVLKNKMTLEPGAYNTSTLIDIIYGIFPNLRNLEFNFKSLEKGYFVNPKFSACSDFKDFPVFLKLMDIPLYHGMIPDPSTPVFQLVSDLDYDELNLIILNNQDNINDRHFTNDEKSLIQLFYENIKHQVTSFGLEVIDSAMKNGGIAIFFRSNHFSVIIKHMNRIFNLITAETFLHTNCFWQTLPTEKGETKMFDQDFILSSLNNQNTPRKKQPQQNNNQNSISPYRKKNQADYIGKPIIKAKVNNTYRPSNQGNGKASTTNHYSQNQNYHVQNSDCCNIM